MMKLPSFIRQLPRWEGPPPPWKDEMECLRFVESELWQGDLWQSALWLGDGEEDRQAAMLDWTSVPDMRVSDFFRMNLQRAIDKARAGDFSALRKIPSRNLSPEAHALLVKNHRRELKGKPGRKKQTSDERRRKNHMHNARDLVPRIRFIFEHYYRATLNLSHNEATKKMHERARRFALKIVGLPIEDNLLKLQNRLRYSRNDKRTVR